MPTFQNAAHGAREALDRTIRLMRDHLVAAATDERLLQSLLSTHVTLVADANNLASPAGQTAFVTTALLLLRSGITVALDAPETPLLGVQAPLHGDELVSALLAVSEDLIPGVRCVRVTAPVTSDAIVLLGDSDERAGHVAALRICLSGKSLEGRIKTGHNVVGRRWERTITSPFGALISGGLAASEVHKVVMRSLRDVACGPTVFDAQFAVSVSAALSLDPDGDVSEAMVARMGDGFDLGKVDAISGGAIIHSVLYALVRLPGVHGRLRVIEPDIAEETNLNRYALLSRSHVRAGKAASLAGMSLGELSIEPITLRYDRSTPLAIDGLADAVIVGVDDIPTRWAAQRARPRWLGIGATTHYSAMSSEHVRGMACAKCLHPFDSHDIGPIPTIAFVSHWAGLLLAWRLVRHRLGILVQARMQTDYLTPLRTDLPASMWRSPVAPRLDCRWCAGLARGAA